jgi:hypothetical protein
MLFSAIVVNEFLENPTPESCSSDSILLQTGTTVQQSQGNGGILCLKSVQSGNISYMTQVPSFFDADIKTSNTKRGVFVIVAMSASFLLFGIALTVWGCCGF